MFSKKYLDQKFTFFIFDEDHNTILVYGMLFMIFQFFKLIFSFIQV